jgi:ubiquinone/menaquinone biosynthesis C-methylase UbiE
MTDLWISQDELRRKYDGLAGVYRQRSWVNENIFGVKRLRKPLLKRAEGQVLEVACGTGENFQYLRQSTSLTAVDLSPQMLELAKQEAQRLGLQVDFKRMSADRLEFADASFDTVVSTMSTCTFPDPVAALQEMRRVCRPTGRILLLEHGRSRWDWLAHYQDRHAHDHFQEAGCRWNQDPVVIVKTAGLQLIESRRHFLGIFHTIESRP